jgi:hypothetical protein
MNRMQRSWELAKASWSVLRSERELAWLPIFSFVASLVVVGIFGLAVWATVGKETGLDGTDHYSMTVAGWILTACAYVAVAFVQTYFLAALCAGANERLRGQDTDLGRALAVANARLHRILPWAIVSATVSMIIQAIEERFGILGRVIAGLLGAGWAVLTFLTVPIIVFEDVGPIVALKRSGTLLKQTWGENVIAQLGLGLLGFVAMVPILVLGFLAAASGTLVVIVPVVVIGVVWLAVVATVMSALSGIYRTALYRFAMDGQVPAAFAGIDFANAFGRKKARNGGFA